jgi:hypothetical protein
MRCISELPLVLIVHWRCRILIGLCIKVCLVSWWASIHDRLVGRWVGRRIGHDNNIVPDFGNSLNVYDFLSLIIAATGCKAGAAGESQPPEAATNARNGNEEKYDY